MWEQEQRVLAWHDRRTNDAGIDREPYQPTPQQLLHTLAVRPTQQQVPLSVEQLEVLDRLLRHRTTAVRGWAGTGKGAVAAAAGAVWREQGRRMLVVAVAGARAAETAAALGEGAEHLSVAQFLHRVGAGRLALSPSDVVLIDEAGQVSTDQWVALAEAIGMTPTLVVLGDEAQLSSIGAGSMWPHLSRGAVELTEVYRTRVAWERDAWTQLRHAQTEEAFTAYAEHGRLHLAGTRAESLERAVRDWARDGRTGLLITDASNAERDWLNQAAQEHRLRAGELGAEPLTVTRSSGPLTLHVGDRVMFQTQYTPTGCRRVENGTTGTVTALDQERGFVVVRTNEATPREVRLFADHAPLDLHYATHVYKAQGSTVDRTYVITGGWQMSKESLYVACSRSRLGTRVYLDRESLRRDIDADALAEAIVRGKRSRAKVAATPLPTTSAQPRHVAAASTAPLGGRHRGPRHTGRHATTKPLTERWLHRKARQQALWLGQWRREHARQVAHEIPTPTLDTLASMDGVPVWALEVAETVTGRSYVAEHAASR